MRAEEAPPGGRSEAALATRGSGIKLAAELAGRLLSLAASFLLAVGLGVQGFGVFAAASGVAVVLAEAADLGLHATASRALVAGTIGLPAVVRAKLALSAIVGTAAALLSLLAPAPEPRALGLAPALLGPLILYFALAGWSEFLGMALRTRGRRGEEAAVLLCLRASTLAAVALALRTGAGLISLAWAHALSTLPPLLLAALLTRRFPVEAPPPAVGDEPGLGAVLRASLPLAVNGGLALISLRLELMAVYFLRGAVEAGLYGAALKIVESSIGVPNAVAAGAMPSLTREALRGSGPVRERVAGMVALLAVPAAAGLVLLAPAVVFLLGPGYAAASGPLGVLALALVALFMNAVLAHSLIAVGRAGALPRLSGTRAAAAALLAVALIPPFGSMGAAGGFLLSEMLLMGLLVRACAAAGFAVPVAAPLALALCLSLPMALVVGLWEGGLAASVALGGLTYAATLAAAWRLRPRLLRFLGEPGPLA